MISTKIKDSQSMNYQKGMTIMTQFSNNFISLYQHNGITLEGLAEKIGVSRQTISKWMNGDSTPDLLYAQKLADYFEVTLDDLVNYPTAINGLGMPPKGKGYFGTVRIGPRGQLVIPKAARDQFNLDEGTTLAILGDENGNMPGLAFVKAEDFMKQAQVFSQMGDGMDVSNNKK